MRIGKTFGILMLLSAAALTTAACSSKDSAKKKSAATKQGQAAKGQKAGASAAGSKDKGAEKGNEIDGVACNAEWEGVAWCDGNNIVFCTSNNWWQLDCGAIGGAKCGENTDTFEVDCYPSSDF